MGQWVEMVPRAGARFDWQQAQMAHAFLALSPKQRVAVALPLGVSVAPLLSLEVAVPASWSGRGLVPTVNACGHQTGLSSRTISEAQNLLASVMVVVMVWMR